jgi:hypothetical protein
MRYKVWDDATIRSGTAREILQEIVNKPTINAEISRMDVDQYAKALIKNAPYYLPKSVLQEVSGRDFQTLYDKALSLLSIMPASNARILTTDPD